jgi:hypothetical protein
MNTTELGNVRETIQALKLRESFPKDCLTEDQSVTAAALDRIFRSRSFLARQWIRKYLGV